ncbi:MAG: hypothetical protein AVDCRST_MAG93-5135, partial [uncultured Chloroflexia bacterium]
FVETPLLKPPGLLFCYRGAVRMIGLFVAALLLLLVGTLVGVMLWLFFLRGG